MGASIDQNAEFPAPLLLLMRLLMARRLWGSIGGHGRRLWWWALFGAQQAAPKRSSICIGVKRCCSLGAAREGMRCRVVRNTAERGLTVAARCWALIPFSHTDALVLLLLSLTVLVVAHGEVRGRYGSGVGPFSRCVQCPQWVGMEGAAEGRRGAAGA